MTRNITNVTTKAVLIAICGLFCALESSRVLAQTIQTSQTQPFPYRAIVTGENAIVHSGPGKTHYGTDRLRPGMEVEVHRHDPGGWLAIRPPKKSFSLIQRDEIEIYENGLAKVTQQETVAWVGTRLNPVKKPMWQVKLRKGEMLEVLGIVDRDRFDLTEKEPDWVQVAPPAGEFRWIAASNIRPLNASDVPSRELDHAEISNFQIEAAEAGSNDSESLNGQSTPNHSSRPAPFDAWEPSQPDTNDWGLDVEQNGVSQNQTERINQLTQGGSQSAGATMQSNPVVDTGWKPAQKTITSFVQERSGFREEDKPQAMYTNNIVQQPGNETVMGNQYNGNVRSGVFDQFDSAPKTQNPVSGMSSNASSTLLTPEFGAGNVAGPGNGSLQSLEMRLTQEMIKPPAQWNLQMLADEVQRARSSFPAQSDQEFLNRMAAKIQKCREIQAGYRATDSSTTPDLQTGQPYTNPNQRTATTNNLLHNYDAYGTLNELVRDGGVAKSTFVLQDDTGRITHHVTPQPGVNLRRYLKQRVGIIGNRGFHQKLNLNHVAAERVISIDTLRR